MSESNTDQTHKNSVDIARLEGKLETGIATITGAVDRIESGFTDFRDGYKTQHTEMVSFITAVNAKAEKVRDEVDKVKTKQAWMLGIAGGLGVAISKFIDYVTGGSGHQ